MIVLRSDNRVLTANSKYSYLVDNVASGAGGFTIINSEGFAVDDFILLEEWGKETAEIFRIGTLDTNSGAITLVNTSGASTNTKFSHPESTKVAVLPYNQIRFYWTAAAGGIADETPVFDTATPLTGFVDLEPASWYTTYADENHSTGFGWFIYYNSIDAISSQESNPIPYEGFSGNTVAQVFTDFDSLLNTNEQKLVTMSEKFSWLNEALALVRNKLNLNNIEYFVSPEQTITIVPGTAEYILPSDFSDLVYINDGSNTKNAIPFLSINKVGTNYPNEGYGASFSGYSDSTRYYLRNRYIGFEPTPTTSASYKYRYRSKSTTVTTISQYIDLPDNAFYALKDFMMYRANLKFNNPVANTYYESFTNSVNHFVQAAVKRDANLDTWDVAPSANV